VEKAGSHQFVFFEHIKLHAVTGHDAAEKAEKAVDTLRAIVGKAPGMPLKQQFVHRLNVDGPADEGKIFVAAQVLALAFAELKAIKFDAKQHHATRLAAPFPIIAAKQQIRPIRPAIFAKAVEDLRVQRLHGRIFFNQVRIEGNVAELWEGLRLQGGNALNELTD